MSRYEQFDRSRLLIKPLAERQHDLHLDRWLSLSDPTPPFEHTDLAAVAARLTAGPIRDLNVMVRRGAWTARVEPWRGGPCSAPDGPMLVMLLEDVGDLAQHDAVLIDARETATLDIPVETRALTIALHRVSQLSASNVQ